MEQKQGGVTENYLYFDPKARSFQPECHPFATSFGAKKPMFLMFPSGSGHAGS